MATANEEGNGRIQELRGTDSSGSFDDSVKEPNQRETSLKGS